MKVISHHDMGMDSPTVHLARLTECRLKGAGGADRREHGQAIVSAVDYMVQRIFVLHT
jgi:hypothetical protein